MGDPMGDPTGDPMRARRGDRRRASYALLLRAAALLRRPGEDKEEEEEEEERRCLGGVRDIFIYTFQSQQVSIIVRPRLTISKQSGGDRLVFFN